MKKMFDIYEHKNDSRAHYGIYTSKDSRDEKYFFCIYKKEIESWYRGEDSGARYPEYGSDIIIERYDITPVLNLMINGITMKEFIDKIYDNLPPYAGEWYTPPSLHTLYRYLDEYVDTDKLKVQIKSNNDY